MTGESDQLPPSRTAALTAIGLVVACALVAGLRDLGDGFNPRVPTLDVLAGLAVGAFVVDRLLTFVPPMGAAKETKQRATDLTILRLGYGAFLGMLFVLLTDLRAIDALTAGGSKGINPGVDRGIAVLAIAGGVAGLARLWSGINPQPPTDGNADPNQPVAEDAAEIPPPGTPQRIAGLVAVAVGAGLALLAVGDKNGVELLGSETGDDGTVALVVRFGLIFVAAAIVQEIAEFTGRALAVPKHNRAVLLGGLSIALGVVAARVFDLYLLHNIGFFGSGPDVELNTALAASTGVERWGDTFMTGVAIAAGSKPLHDFASRLRKAKK